MKATFKFRVVIVGAYTAEDFSSDAEAFTWFQRNILGRQVNSHVVEQMIENSEVDEVGSDITLQSVVMEEGA